MDELRIDSPATLPHRVFPWPAFEMKRERCVLLAIDYQNYSVNPAYGLRRLVIECYPETARHYIPRITQVTLPNTWRLIDAFRAAGREVIYTRNDGLVPDGRDLVPRRRRDTERVLAFLCSPAGGVLA